HQRTGGPIESGLRHVGWRGKPCLPNAEWLAAAGHLRDFAGVRRDARRAAVHPCRHDFGRRDGPGDLPAIGAVMNAFHSSWFYWAIAIAVGLPIGLILLTELQHTLLRRKSRLAGQVSLLRNFLLPLGALLLLLVKTSQVPAGEGLVRILT